MKKNRIQMWSMLLFLFVSFLLFFPMKGLANDSSFYVTPVVPENQLDNTTDYFNIAVPAVMDQTLELIVVNESAETKKLQLTLLDGMTTKDGTISYDKNHDYDESQQYKMSQIAKLEQNELAVEPNSSTTVTVQLKADIKDFFGTILGAVNVSEKEEKNSQTGVNNSFAYNIPIKIRVAEENQQNKINYKGMALDSEKSRQAIELKFQNPESNILKKVAFSFSVYKKGNTSTSLWNNEMSDVEIAPNSLFSPELLLTDANLKAGDYILKIVATSDEINETWESEFTIASSGEKMINEGLEVLTDSNQWWLIIAVVIIVLGGGIYVFYKKKS